MAVWESRWRPPLETPASRILTWRSVVEEVLGDVEIEGSLIARSDTLLGISGSTLKISLSVSSVILFPAKVENKPFELCILPTPSEHSSGVAVSSVAVSSVFLISFGCGATCGKGAGSVSGGTAVEVDAGAEGEGKVGARR